jgi:Na+/H+ antiporter NhaC
MTVKQSPTRRTVIYLMVAVSIVPVVLILVLALMGQPVFAAVSLGLYLIAVFAFGRQVVRKLPCE